MLTSHSQGLCDDDNFQYVFFANPSGNNYTEAFDLAESPLYGSSRIGIESRTESMTTASFTSPTFTDGLFNKTSESISVTNNPSSAISRTLGSKVYELTNHLGNVLATVNDRRIQEQDGVTDNVTSTVVDFYSAEVRSVSDYYPFGSSMPGRTYSTPNYRYGFNGMEKDDELKGSGNSYDFGARMYDPRIGRWLSMDLYTVEFPHSSPYNFALNSPLVVVDPDGKYVYIINDDGSVTKVNPEMDNIQNSDLMASVKANHATEMGNAVWSKYSESQTDHVFLFSQNWEESTGSKTVGQTYKSLVSASHLDKNEEFSENGKVYLYLAAADKNLSNILTDIDFNKDHSYTAVGLLVGLKGYGLAETIYHELQIHIENHIKETIGHEEHRAAGVFVDEDDNYWFLEGGKQHAYNVQLIDQYSDNYVEKAIRESYLDDKTLNQVDFDKKIKAQIETEKTNKTEVPDSGE